MHLVEFVKVGAGCVESFAGFKCLFNVRPDFGQGVVVGKVFGALPEVVNGFYVPAPDCLLEAPTWLDGVTGDVNENILGG